MTDKPTRPDGGDSARWAAVFDAIVQAVVTIDSHGSSLHQDVASASGEAFDKLADEIRDG